MEHNYSIILDPINYHKTISTIALFEMEDHICPVALQERFDERDSLGKQQKSVGGNNHQAHSCNLDLEAT